MGTFESKPLKDLSHNGHEGFDKSWLFKSFLGFPYTTVAPGAAAKITSASQVLFRPLRLVVDPTIAKYFLLTDIRIGARSLLPNAQPLPCTAFPPLPASPEDKAIMRELEEILVCKHPCLQISQCITLCVVNTSKEVLPFSACFWGDYVENYKEAAAAGEIKRA